MVWITLPSNDMQMGWSAAGSTIRPSAEAQEKVRMADAQAKLC